MLFEKNYNRILVVDDNEDHRDIFARALAGKGYDLSTAINGQHALDVFKKQPFPIVITDMVMPKMNGIELLKQIKIISPLTEVIIISGYEDIDLAVESFRNQAMDFIKKPVDIKALELAVKTAKEKIMIKKGLFDYTENLERLVEKKTCQLENIQKFTKDNNKLKSLLNNLPVVIFIIDDNYKITALNNMYKQKFGDYTGSCCYQVTRKKNHPCKNCPARKALQTNHLEQAEINFIDTDGQEISSLVCASPVAGTTKNATNIMIISADLSTVKGINNNLSSLGLMVGSVSHGIKGLLTGLDGGVYVLDSALKRKDQKQAVEGLDMVRTVTSRMKNMVLDILFYSRERELKKEKINSRKFTNDLLKIISPKAEQQNILVKQDLSSEEFTFQADSGILISALINIFDNAIDACLEDQSKNDHEVNFTFSRQQGNVEMTISDNGTGIDEADIENIFTLFNSGKGKHGTGLGLFIADKVIRQHGGTIHAKSKKSIGTTFIISFPLILG